MMILIKILYIQFDLLVYHFAHKQDDLQTQNRNGGILPSMLDWHQPNIPTQKIYPLSTIEKEISIHKYLQKTP